MLLRRRVRRDDEADRDDAAVVLYPASRVLTCIFPVFLVRIPAWVFLGAWFLYQLIEADFGLFNGHANGGGVAFFARAGGFVSGLLAARLLARAARAAPRERWRSAAQRRGILLAAGEGGCRR